MKQIEIAEATKWLEERYGVERCTNEMGTLTITLSCEIESGPALAEIINEFEAAFPTWQLQSHVGYKNVQIFQQSESGDTGRGPTYDEMGANNYADQRGDW